MREFSVRFVLLVVLVEAFRAVFLAIFAGHAAVHRLLASIAFWLWGRVGLLRRCVTGFWSPSSGSWLALCTTCCCASISRLRFWLWATTSTASGRCSCGTLRRALLCLLFLFGLLPLQVCLPAAFAGGHRAVSVGVAHAFPESILHLRISRESIQSKQQ